MLLPQLSRCCCGCTLQTGTVLIGAYQVVRGLLEFISDLTLESTVSFNRGRDGWVFMWEGVSIVAGMLGIIRMLAAVFLIFGVNKERSNLVLWWLIFIATLTVLSFALFPLSLASFYYYSGTTEFLITLLLGLLDFGLELYFMVVVNSYYRIIQERVPPHHTQTI